MAKRKRPRRLSVPGLVKFEEPDPAAWAGSRDAPLLRLVARMRVAEQALHNAMDELAQAEQRLSQLPAVDRTSRQPPWFTAAVQGEQVAGDALEKIYDQITQARAHTKAGLGIKLRLLAELYGGTFDEVPDETDLVSVFIDSLIADVSD